jgi:hypothetical protein
MAELPREFAPSPQVKAWLLTASLERKRALTELLIPLALNPLPGGSLLKIMENKEPPEILPRGYTVPFCNDECLLRYEIPVRTEDPIKLVFVFDPEV